MRRFTLLVTVLMTLWLPLQAVAAVTMPFCEQGQGQAPANHESPVGGDVPLHHHDGSQPAHSDHPATGHQDSSPLQCNGCGPCHLACAPMLGVAVAIAVAQPSYRFSPLAQVVPPAYSPEQPNPPPL